MTLPRPAPDPALGAWLTGHPHPLVRARALQVLGYAAADDAEVRALVDAGSGCAELRPLAVAQREDGSWGTAATASGRIVSTLLAVRSLTDAGLTDRLTMVAAALDFLQAHAIVDSGGSIYGDRDSVVPCYTGFLAEVHLKGGRPDGAVGPLEWLCRYQPIVSAGVDHAPGAEIWGGYLRTRYGGCTASTTCLIGLYAGVNALLLARSQGLSLPSRADVLIAGMRQVLSDRRVCHTGDGRLLPLAGRTKRDPDGTRWLAPAFPRSYLPDLVDLTGLALDVGVPDERVRPAWGMLGRLRLPDGSWPLTGKRHLTSAFRPEPVSPRRPSAWITLRCLEIVGALGYADPARPPPPRRRGARGERCRSH